MSKTFKIRAEQIAAGMEVEVDGVFRDVVSVRVHPNRRTNRVEAMLSFGDSSLNRPRYFSKAEKVTARGEKPKPPALPDWAKVGASVLIRSEAYGGRIAASAQRGSIVEVRAATRIIVVKAADVIDRESVEQRKFSGVRYKLSDDGEGAVEIDTRYRRKCVRPNTPKNRELWSAEMREFSRRMAEQRRQARNAAKAKADAEALRARRIEALNRLEAKILDGFDFREPNDPSVQAERELVAFVRGIIGSGDHD